MCWLTEPNNQPQPPIAPSDVGFAMGSTVTFSTAIALATSSGVTHGQASIAATGAAEPAGAAEPGGFVVGGGCCVAAEPCGAVSFVSLSFFPHATSASTSAIR